MTQQSGARKARSAVVAVSRVSIRNAADVQADQVLSHPMMKKISFALLGALAGCLLVGAALFLSGAVLQWMDIRLFASEADQQRNFNVALSIAAVCGVVGGWLGYRLAGRIGSP